MTQLKGAFAQIARKIDTLNTLALQIELTLSFIVFETFSAWNIVSLFLIVFLKHIPLEVYQMWSWHFRMYFKKVKHIVLESAQDRGRNLKICILKPIHAK